MVAGNDNVPSSDNVPLKASIVDLTAISYFNLAATDCLGMHLSIGFASLQVQGQMKIEAKLQTESGILSNNR